MDQRETVMTAAEPGRLLRNLARTFYRRGWMDGTAGNLSLRQGQTLFITASGRPKGSLSPAEILAVPMGPGPVPPEGSSLRPSAEISIHQTLYRIFPKTEAVLHVHTVEAALASDCRGDSLSLPPLEVLKGLGVADPRFCPPLPVFENDLQIPEIAKKIGERLSRQENLLPGLLIRHHGTTAWGPTLESAIRHLELLEFCFRYLQARKTAHHSGNDSLH